MLSTCIPIHPSAGLHWSSLQLHVDKHCFPYHGYGHTISHWDPIVPASHSVNACKMKPEEVFQFILCSKIPSILRVQTMFIWKYEKNPRWDFASNRHWKSLDNNVKTFCEILRETSK